MNAVIAKEIATLSTGQRLDLIGEIWDTLSATPVDVPVSASHRAELDRRLDALERTPETGRPWTEVRDELLRR